MASSIEYRRYMDECLRTEEVGGGAQVALAACSDMARSHQPRSKRRAGETERDGERSAHPASAGTVNYCAGRRAAEQTSALRVSPLRGL
jgi:hypothetical protein